jgi:Protein of unknown function (DUF4245)
MRWCRSVTSTRPTTEVVKPPKRGSQTALDMVRSLGLIVVILAVTLAFDKGLFHPSKSEQFPVTDYSDYVQGFKQVTNQAALVPTPQPTGWRSNAAALTGPDLAEHLHIGWATPGSNYAGLEESVAPLATFVPTVLGKRGSTVTGLTVIAGSSWQTRTSSRGEYSLSRTINGIAVVITGSEPQAGLRSLAASLRPAS